MEGKKDQIIFLDSRFCTFTLLLLSRFYFCDSFTMNLESAKLASVSDIVMLIRDIDRAV